MFCWSKIFRIISIRSVSSQSPPDIPYVVFNNGIKFPVFGLGTWKSKVGEVKTAVKHALDVGYRHIDCAHIYQNEREVGEAISKTISDKKVTRSQIFITSKLWNTFHKPQLVEKAIRTTLKNLKLDYLDLYLMHWPMDFREGDDLNPRDSNDKFYASNIDYLDTWKSMEKLLKDGLTRSIGISNFNENQIVRLLNEAKVRPVTNQIESHPYLTQKSLLSFCKSNNIVVTAYSPLGSGGKPKLLTNKMVLTIADKRKKTAAQILLRYQIQMGNIVIPKSVNKSRIEENMKIFDFDLEIDEIDLLDSLNINHRYVPFKGTEHHRFYPF